MVGVTWFEAQAYCAWLTAVTSRTFRLPTEAEWEAAARGVEGSTYPWGDSWDSSKANTIESRVLQPSPVGVYVAAGGKGAFEAEDQSGNVWEWTSSLYRDYPYDSALSEQPEEGGHRVLRGGSWLDGGRFARCAYRDRYVPGLFYYDVGFRLVSPGIFLDSGS